MSRKVNADLHNHLRTWTWTGKKDFDRAVKAAFKRLGSGGVLGITNFADTRYELYTRQPRRHFGDNKGNAIHVIEPERDLLVVKGQEVQTNQGHLLILGLMQDVHLRSSRRVTLEDALSEAEDNNGIIIADHPFYFEGVGSYLQRNPRILERIDALELNGSAIWIPGKTPRHTNQKLLEFYLDITEDFPHLGVIANSDGHSFWEIGKSYSKIRALNPSNADSITSSLRAGIRACTPEIEDITLRPSMAGAYLHAALLAPYILGVLHATNPKGESHK